MTVRRFAACLGLFWAFLAACLAPVRAHASCGAESCPLDNSSFGGARRWSLDVSYQHTEQDRLRTGTQPGDASGFLVDGGEVLTRSHTTMTKLTVPLPWRTQISASLPVVDRLHRHVTAEGLPQPELREWQYHGLGDMTVLTSWTAIPRMFYSAPVSVSLQTGVKLPTGRRSVPNIDGEELEPHARPGSGSTDFLAGMSLVQTLALPSFAGPGHATSLFVSALYMYTGRGTEGWRLGRSLDANVGASHPIWHRVSLIAQVNTRVHAKDQQDVSAAEAGGHQHLGASLGNPMSTGRAADAKSAVPGGGPTLLHETSVGGIDENTGGTSVFASPGLRFEALPGVTLSCYAQIPLYQRVNGTQLVSGTQFYFGATYRLR